MLFGRQHNPQRHQGIIALWRAHRIVSDAWWWRWWAHPQRFALVSAGLRTIDAIDAAMAQHAHTPDRRLGDASSPGPNDDRLHGDSRPGRRPPLRATATSRNASAMWRHCAECGITTHARLRGAMASSKPRQRQPHHRATSTHNLCYNLPARLRITRQRIAPSDCTGDRTHAQAHMAAKTHSTPTQARLPQPHGHQRRPLSPQAAAPPGALAPDGERRAPRDSPRAPLIMAERSRHVAYTMAIRRCDGDR